MYYIYLVECKDKTLYCGVTTDLARRVKEHNEGTKGAKYTRARRPVKVVWSARARTRARAQQREAEIKKLPKTKKLKLISESVITRSSNMRA